MIADSDSRAGVHKRARDCADGPDGAEELCYHRAAVRSAQGIRAAPPRERPTTANAHSVRDPPPIALVYQTSCPCPRTPFFHAAGDGEYRGISDLSNHQAATHEFRNQQGELPDRKSTRLNSSHLVISYAVFCLKKKKTRTSYWSLVCEC